MIFFNKYKIDLDISRYDALKLLLDNFHQLGSDSDFDKLFYGTCENGVFHFKAKRPTAATYTYVPSCMLSIDEGEGGKAVLNIKSSAVMLLIMFIMAVITAILFGMMFALMYNARFFIGVAVSLVIAFLIAFISCKQQIKIKKMLSSLYALD